MKSASKPKPKSWEEAVADGSLAKLLQDATSKEVFKDKTLIEIRRTAMGIRSHIGQVLKNANRLCDDIESVPSVTDSVILVRALRQIANGGNWGDAQWAKGIAREALKSAGIKLKDVND